MDTETRNRLMNEGKCFRYQKTGYLSRDCPHKKSAQVKILEEDVPEELLKNQA
jgi:hypothetical protein